MHKHNLWIIILLPILMLFFEGCTQHPICYLINADNKAVSKVHVGQLLSINPNRTCSEQTIFEIISGYTDKKELPSQSEDITIEAFAQLSGYRISKVALVWEDKGTRHCFCSEEYCDSFYEYFSGNHLFDECFRNIVPGPI